MSTSIPPAAFSALARQFPFSTSDLGGRGRLQLVGLCVVFVGCESLCYILAVEPVYNYAGFIARLSPLKLLEAVLSVVLMALCLPHKVLRPSDFFCHILFIGSMSGMAVLYFFKDESRYFYYLVVLSFLAVTILGRVSWRGRVRVTLPSGSPHIAIFILASILVLYVSQLTLSGAWHYFNLDVYKVYDTRLATSGLTTSGALNYISIWAPAVCGPVLFALALYKRNVWLSVILFLIQLFIVGSTGNKIFIVNVLLIFLLYAYVAVKDCVRRLYYVMSLIMILAVAEYVVFSSYFLSGVIVRRVFLLPAFLNYAYYYMAEQYGYIWWSNSFLDFLSSQRWSVGPAEMVSYFLWRHVNTHANTGFLGSGYVQAGVFGIMTYSAVLAVLLRLFDMVVVNRLSNRFAIAVATPSLWTVFISSDLPTALLTHGVGLLLLALWLLGPSGETDRLELKEA